MFGTRRICSHTFLSLLDRASVVFDFGANQGEFSHEIIQAFGCKVFAIEPVPKLADAIEPHQNLRLYRLALADRVGTASLNIFVARCASLYPTGDAAEGDSRTQVATTTFSDFRKRTGVSRINLLKIDIERAELDLFESTPDDELLRCDQITVEFHDFLCPDDRPRVDAARKRLRDIGFFEIRFSLDNTDVLFVNKKTRISPVHVLFLKSVVKYALGIRRRLERMWPQAKH
jgi:FkbM family methyltransferase